MADAVARSSLGRRLSRVDARASAARILDAARSVFAAGDGSGPLSRIAQEAGVGIATLYRHFPNRQILARAVYDRVFTDEVSPLLAHFADANSSREVLLDVVEKLDDIAHREPGLVAALGSLTEATTDLLRHSMDTLEPLLESAQVAGTIRPDISVDDIPHLLALGAAMVGTGSRLDRVGRRRYLSLLLDGLNPARATPLPS